jgi:ABC-type multidrug transport system fused ATPase/permease subunit
MSDSPDPRAEEVLGKAYDGRLMRRLLGYLAPYRRHALGALALMVVSSAGQLFGPVATAVAFDHFLAPATPAGDRESPRRSPAGSTRRASTRARRPAWKPPPSSGARCCW